VRLQPASQPSQHKLHLRKTASTIFGKQQHKIAIAFLAMSSFASFGSRFTVPLLCCCFVFLIFRELDLFPLNSNDSSTIPFRFGVCRVAQRLRWLYFIFFEIEKK
jgi:hypothetical protein